MCKKLNDFKDCTSEKLNKVNFLVNFVSTISLFVRGIGVMVIMLVTVNERTQEIGICKSIGTKNKDVVTQFLSESLTLSLTAGIIGIVFGYIGSLITRFFTTIPPVIDYKLISKVSGLRFLIEKKQYCMMSASFSDVWINIKHCFVASEFDTSVLLKKRLRVFLMLSCGKNNTEALYSNATKQYL